MLELLLVAAVVSILASVLFAVIGRVQENGRRTVCLNNLKQLSLGLQQYVQDNDSRFPTNLFPLEPLSPYVKSKKLLRRLFLLLWSCLKEDVIALMNNSESRIG
jgi:type II secretory pathway pseudopilin PulG